MPKLPNRKPMSPYRKLEPIPPRVSRDYEPMHCYSDGKGGVWTHNGYSRDCVKPECVQWHQEQGTPILTPPGAAPWGYPDPLAPCPKFGGKHRWTWADDGNGHSGDVCECGAYER